MSEMGRKADRRLSGGIRGYPPLHPTDLFPPVPDVEDQDANGDRDDNKLET